MPTTTSRGLPIRGMLAALVVWFLGMTAGVFVVQPPTIVVFGAPDRLVLAAAETEAILVSATRTSVTMRPGATDTVRRLYRGGAWLVWPSFDTGCIGRKPSLQSMSSTASPVP